MKQRHLGFLIACASWFTLAMAYAMNTEIGIKQGVYQTAGQVSFYLLFLAGAYYGIFYLIDKIRKPKTSNASV